MRVMTSKRLILRPWEADDAAFLLDLEGRWDVVHYLGADPKTMTSLDEALASIGRRRAIGEHPVHGVWIITDTAGAPLGNLLLKPAPMSAGVDSPGTEDVEIGWHLHPDARGRGYATEAANTAAADAFARGQRRIIALTHPGNRASQAVCRRIGMRHLGTTTRYMDMSCDIFVLDGER